MNLVSPGRERSRMFSKQEPPEGSQKWSWEALYEIVERAPFGVYIVDSTFRIAQINADSQERAFRNVRPAVGRDFAEAIRILWPEDVAASVIKEFRNTLDTGQPYYSHDYVHPRADIDGVEAYEWQLHRLTLPDGTYGVVCYYYDSTELRQAEESLRDANRRKDEFLAMLAHELRNPLAAIRNGVQILLRPDNDGDTARLASEIVDRQVRHLIRQVDDLLDVSRISRGIIELRKERTDLVAVVQHAIEAIRPHCDQLGHELIVMMPTQPLYVHGDGVRLAQVLGNLLSNACKFTDKGGRVQLALEREGEHAVIRVTDSGIGIAAEELFRIFDIFAQVDTTLERTRDGLGLGLALVKNLVEMHDGKVEARSDGLGKGSEFVLRLPLVAAPTEPATKPTPAPDTISVRRRVLVVDDNRDSADSLAMLLTLMGHEVDTAHDGIEAIEKAETFRADIILLDIGMPRLNGYEAARRLRELHPRNDLTLVALTGWGQAEDRRLSDEAGFDAHLVKPLDFGELSKLLK